MSEKILFTWSGGKDSALALHELRQANNCEIVCLLTTVTQGYDRISMHGVRNELLERQAKSLGLPLRKIEISQGASNEEYQTKMGCELEAFKAQGVTKVAFGDIFLEDLRDYRVEKLKQVGLEAIFPIWKRDTKELAKSFIDNGFKTVITCIDSQLLERKFAGMDFDDEFLSELPEKIDPCGENGEFHSFAYDGPIFSNPINFKKGEVQLRAERFYYCDLIPE